ncbi:MAG: hypothetical protein ABIT38_15175 [Gemmatimonadaceae bacterium]
MIDARKRGERSRDSAQGENAELPRERGADAAPATERWHELRSLLVEPERQRLARIERELANPNLHADAIADALPEAVRRRTKRDRALGDALGPVVGEAIRASVMRDPQPLVDAIFPIIGPAIRRSISTALAEMVQGLNQSLEHTFTPRGIAWRIEAMRTGRSFGEVVLSHSLVFRVEQLFLIERESGLLIEHRIAPGVHAPPPDMVASMITALRDFARDSFRMSEAEGLNALALGDLTVWVESGPQAMLAAVIRGQPPIGLREEMQKSLEDVHRIHGNDLENFRKTGVSFETSTGLLDRVLVSQLQPQTNAAWRTWLLGAIVVAFALWFFVPRIIEKRRFDRWVGRLRAAPGIVVSEASRDNGHFVVSGLRDPLAVDPETLLAGTGLDAARVSAKWEPYVALRPEFVLRRARVALNTPTTVALRIAGDTLIGNGVATAQWLAAAEAMGRAVAGVSVVQLVDVQDSALVVLRAHADRVQRTSFDFATASVFPTPGQLPRLDSLAADIKALQSEAERARRVLYITFIGSADSLGAPASNAVLRAGRAASVRALLLVRGVGGTTLQTEADSSASSRLRQVRLRVALIKRDSLSRAQ